MTPENVTETQGAERRTAEQFGAAPGYAAKAAGKLCFYLDDRGVLTLNVPGWDDFGERCDAQWTLSEETGARLARELAGALQHSDVAQRHGEEKL